MVRTLADTEERLIARVAVKKRTAASGLILWTLALAFGSLQPARLEIIHLGFAHRLMHTVSFAILALLAIAVFSGPRWLTWSALACWLFGIGLEVSQHFVYRIPFEWNDIRDDGIGVGVVVGLQALAWTLRL